MEMLGAFERSKLITGDGVYEETWAAPHRWRREVTLGSYHAVEVESEQGRKMQTSSDYEPSRILMLLKALLEPIPKNVRSREFKHLGADGWSVRTVVSEGKTLTVIGKSSGNQNGTYSLAYYLSDCGVLLMSNHAGLVTMFQDELAFHGSVVARHISVRAGAERVLLDAQVAVEDTNGILPETFDLSAPFAPPGSTLRPLEFFETRAGLNTSFGTTTPQSQYGQNAFSIAGVVDRNGRYRELEVILEGNGAELEKKLEALRDYKDSSPTFERTPCELAWIWAFLG